MKTLHLTIEPVKNFYYKIEDYFGYDLESEIYEYCLSETKDESFCMNVAQKYLDHEDFEIVEQNKSYENGLFIAYLIKKKSDDPDDIDNPRTTSGLREM